MPPELTFPCRDDRVLGSFPGNSSPTTPIPPPDCQLPIPRPQAPRSPPMPPATNTPRSIPITLAVRRPAIRRLVFTHKPTARRSDRLLSFLIDLLSQQPTPNARSLPPFFSSFLSFFDSSRLFRRPACTMAMAPTDRRKPFTSWVKRLNQKMKRTKGPNNPYPQSGHVSSRHGLPPPSPSTTHHQQRGSHSIDYPQSTVESAPDPELVVHSAEELSRQSMQSTSAGRPSGEVEGDGDCDAEGRPPTTAPSYGGTSFAGTNITATDARRPDSTFSSPAPSARSVATTLSTMQTNMANGLLPGQPANTAAQPTSRPQQHQVVQYTQPEALVTAMPGSDGDRNRRSAYRPATYSAIIANNLLSDNISILTLASSTQRRRRRSWDTDYDHASVRALPPASQFGGSRESLPLSVLSANLDGQQPTSPGLTTARSIAERSVSGLALGHGRADSLSGSVGGGAIPVASES